MEQPGSSRRSVRDMTARFDCLTDAYRCFLSGSCPSERAADLACVIFAEMCGRVAGEDRGYYHDKSVELTCISLTLVEKITSSLTAESLTPEVTSYCVEILRVLFQDMDLMSQLVHQFQAEDQTISHLAAKSVSTHVLYDLHKSGTVSPVWQQKCVQLFHRSSPCTELDACLWSLIEVLKRLLKGAHQERSEILEKLLSAFDSSLSALCSKFLPVERKAVTQRSVDLTSSTHRGTTFYLLLELLEVLTASSFICGTGVCLKSQRLTYIHSSALLTTVSSSSEHFVKKRVLLLLKRAVLQKAGEDWALGEMLSTGLKHEYFSSDMSILAQSVLQAVAADWLLSVQAESVSFFGGTSLCQGGEGQKPDCVMLRAVSLLLLKSLELHIQTAAGTAGLQSVTEGYGYLQTLLAFLRRCSVQMTEVIHCCCWVSLLFGEQDDDMMEAAKAFLSIFLHHRVCSGLDDFAVLEAACASGCNPHCHFLLLLQSISFDHSILLDFLISTETCFLEYFVRYLKYLRTDWQGFTVTCQRVSLTASCGAAVSGLTFEWKTGTRSCQNQVESGFCFQPTTLIPPVEGFNSAPGPRLVEYDSSDESDPDNMEVSEDSQETWKRHMGPEVSLCEQSGFSDWEVKQDTCSPPISISQTEHVSSDSTELRSDPISSMERRPGGSPLPVGQSKHSGQVSCETLARAMFCLSELREVVTRLQTKKLFPYNPSSLLKLLAQLEKYSQHSHQVTSQ
ncbi:protein Lines homolog 1 isoform X2 [Thunnus albacares]|uniref:protein Lines homolog 1 isoform X2 n=1 Tax=Thunnus albacares TaxID=8236 RepID=UPI001CF707AA|nr:protein Lines homolog 1 isoform X2 [Thunnus albacares]